MTTFGISLLSGGLDSTTVTAYARKHVDKLLALTFHYGQTHVKEVDCAQRIAKIMDINHKLVDISFLGDIAWYSSLTSPTVLPMPKDRYSENMGHEIPTTYVPLRNTIFLTLAAALLESHVLNAIESEHIPPKEMDIYLYMAPNIIDYSGYPDCRPEYFKKMERALKAGSKLWTQYGVAIKIKTPVIQFSKAEIIALGTDLKAPIEHTWSCYEGGDMPCGRCDSCILRAHGFKEAGIVDPLLEQLDSV